MSSRFCVCLGSKALGRGRNFPNLGTGVDCFRRVGGLRGAATGIQAPLTSLSAVQPDLKLPVDGSNSAATASHSVCDFGKGHVAFTKQHGDSVQFILGKVFTLRPNHV